jgi:hypothetical protein
MIKIKGKTINCIQKSGGANNKKINTTIKYKYFLNLFDKKFSLEITPRKINDK